MPQQVPSVAAEPTHDRDEFKEVKVSIRISQHIKLHTIRLLMDQTLSATVRNALDRYFRDLAEERAEPPSGGGS